jgi:hypothetical protein
MTLKKRTMVKSDLDARNFIGYGWHTEDEEFYLMHRSETPFDGKMVGKYKDDLIKEFNIEIPEGVFDDPWFKLLESTFNQKVNTESETLIMSLITSKIEEEMKKEMPDPWYCYGFGGKEN